MDPKDLKLPQVADEVFGLGKVPEKIYKILWSVDPAILRRFEPPVLNELARINTEYLAKSARLEAQQKELEAEAYEAVSKVLNR